MQVKPSSDLAGQPTFRLVDGVSIRFAQSSQRASCALLLSPWPESIFAYEAVWSTLARTAHLVAIDLPGFGRSERREALLSPRAMADFIVRVADEFRLDRPHVIGPDVGTSAALFAAARHPGRFLSLVVGSGAAAFPLDLTDPLREWVSAPDLTPYRRLGGRPVVERAMQSLERYTISQAAREDYWASYDGDRFAESIRYVQTYPRELDLLQDVLKCIETPVQIIAGRRDRVVPPSNAQYLHERLPCSDLRLLDTTHFLWEDAADQYAALVSDWWADGYRKCVCQPPPKAT
jgi:pimeloyl-ACP methyl ester carboxylesterase